MAKAKDDEAPAWSPERLIWELAQLVRLALPPSPDHLKRLSEWSANFQKNHPEVADEIRDEAQAKVKATEAAAAAAADQAQVDAQAARPSSKKNEGLGDDD